MIYIDENTTELNIPRTWSDTMEVPTENDNTEEENG